jgi:hypothetical protein
MPSAFAALRLMINKLHIAYTFNDWRAGRSVVAVRM